MNLSLQDGPRRSSPPGVDGAPASDAPPHATVVDRLRYRAQTQPDALALFELPGLRSRGEEITYGGLDARARAVAARLQAAGARGDRALIVMGNRLEYVVAFFACAYAGCVGVNLLPPSRPKHLARLAHVAEDCDARFLLTAGPEGDALSEHLGSHPSLARLTVLRVDRAPAEEAGAWQPRSPSPAQACYLQYTSGSTGAPRGVIVSHANLADNSERMRAAFGFTGADRALSWLPLYHDMGLILGVLQPLWVGFPVALTDPLSFVKRPDLWLKAISDLRITFAGGPNFTFDLCADAVDPADLPGVDLSSWQVALNGAEPIRARTLERFTERFAPLGWRPEVMQPSFGLAEFTLEVVTKRRGTLPVQREVDAAALGRGQIRGALPQRRARRLVSSGHVPPGMAIAIVDPQADRRAEPGHIGEIWLGGPSVAGGYWRQEALTREVFEARIEGDDRPWLRTGDLGFIEDDALFITGRLKDVVIVHGVNHYPQDLEETAEVADPAVRPNFAAVFSDEQGDREVIVVVAEILKDAAPTLDVAGVAGRIAQAIAREHEVQVERVCLAHHGQVPKTTSGKIQRSACRRLLAQGELALHGEVRRSDP